LPICGERIEVGLRVPPKITPPDEKTQRVWMNPAWPSSAPKGFQSRRKAQPCPSARRALTTPNATPSGTIWARW